MLKGLSSPEVERLLRTHGLNVIEETRKDSLILIFLRQFKDVLTLLLLGAAGISFFISEIIDGSLILAIIFLNAVFKIYQERKAEEAISALKKLAVTVSRVIRDGKEMEIDSSFLVPKDIILIEEGMKIPADAKVFKAVNLEVNEASLTGESIPVYKYAGDEIFMGTVIFKGRAQAQITQTGMKTRFGQIANSLSKIEKTSTPLQRKLNSLLKIIGVVGIIFSIAVLGLSFINGSGYFPAFLLAISLAVAIVPEGLPAVTTITLALGVKEMAKKKAVVRRLEAIEAIGNITLIATDKTGTLTSNDMRIKEILTDGKIFEDHQSIPHDNPSLKKLITNGILCSTASLVYVHDHNSWEVLGDPTEGSLLLFAREHFGIDPEELRTEWQFIKEGSFDILTKTMSVVVKKDNKEIMFIKGAPEAILEKCGKILIAGKEVEFTQERRHEVEKTLDHWTKKGYRVIAFSYQDLRSKIEDQIFIGMVAIHDPPRPEVKGAVEKAYRAGIKVVIITGDNEKTAEAVGVAVNIIKEGDLILTGKQIESYTDEELLEKLPKVKIFARTTPLHKSRIVSLYQKLGEIVAVTGDGVNDAIALKQADVGISMGKVGTDVARETSDIVIMDDNFATIISAVEEGRNIVKNLKNSIKYLLSTNATEALALMTGLILGVPAFFSAVQILYINFISDGIPALALAFSPREDHLMNKPPEKKLSLFNNFDKRYIILVAFLATSLVMVSYFLFKSNGEDVGKTAAFSVLAMIQSFVFVDLWLSHRSINKHVKSFLSKAFLIAFAIPIVNQFMIVNIPSLSKLFKVEMITTPLFLELLIVTMLVLPGIGLIKKIIKR
ncbi:MAG: cation-translocating P-type ATPase [Candidatus Roizmanbacteria bacterium]|nr:MAG: cation-translocating P-type ATPase [Candidatus Roizmanbacteria bacterium]